MRRMGEMELGGRARIVGLAGAETAFGRRLYALGFTPGSTVECIAVSPLGDPRAYRVKGTVIALRRRDAMAVYVE